MKSVLVAKLITTKWLAEKKFKEIMEQEEGMEVIQVLIIIGIALVVVGILYVVITNVMGDVQEDSSNYDDARADNTWAIT